MYLKTHSLTIRNFQSFGNNVTHINLNFDGSMLIQGKNHDSVTDGQLDSNGSGKSTIMHALCYAGYDRIISEETGQKTKDSLINNRNEKNMEVTWDFEKEGQVFYRVERYRKNKAKGGDGVRLFRRVGDADFSADDEMAPDSILNTNDLIAKIIGMPFEIFSRIIVFSATNEPFLSLPSTHATKSNQTDVIEELCGITELSEKAEKLKKKVTDNKKELQRLQDVNDVLVAERERNTAQINSAKSKVDQWDAEHDQQVEDNKKALSEVDDTIEYDEQIELFENIAKIDTATIMADIREMEAERDTIVRNTERSAKWVADTADAITTAKANLEKFPLLDFDAISKAIQRKSELTTEMLQVNAAIEKIEREVARYTTDLEKEEVNLAHLFDSKCSYCAQNYAAAKLKIPEATERVEELKGLIKNCAVEIDTLQLSIPMLKSELDNMATVPFHSESDLSAYRSKHDKVKVEFDAASNAKNPYAGDLVNTSEDLKMIEDNLITLNINLTKRTAKITAAKKALKFTTMAELVRHKSNAEALRVELTRLSSTRNPHTATLLELEAVVLEASKNDEIAAIEDLLEHQSFLVKLLTKKDSFMRKFLLQKTLPFLNTRLKHYLDMLGLPHKVSFREDLMVKISQFDKEIPFYRLSSGQKARINLALSFSFRDILQQRHGRINLCILDECLDVGLGNVGVTLAAKMIKQVSAADKLSTFVISHRDEVSSMFDKKMVVELRNGLSTIEYVS